MENLENLLKCKVCDEILNRPTILGCGHTFCTTCVTGCELCPQCEASQGRWRRRTKSKIQIMTKWHAGDDIATCFRHHRKDSEKIISTLKANMKCPICCGFLNKATVTVCGHVYCKRCLDSWTDRHQHCPVCRAQCHCQESVAATQSFPWPLGDLLTEETRRTFKRSRTDDSDLEEEIWMLNYHKRLKVSQGSRRSLAVLASSVVVASLVMSLPFWPI